jgi:hypothetical protein
MKKKFSKFLFFIKTIYSDNLFIYNKNCNKCLFIFKKNRTKYSNGKKISTKEKISINTNENKCLYSFNESIESIAYNVIKYSTADSKDTKVIIIIIWYL